MGEIPAATALKAQTGLEFRWPMVAGQACRSKAKIKKRTMATDSPTRERSWT